MAEKLPTKLQSIQPHQPHQLIHPVREAVGLPGRGNHEAFTYELRPTGNRSRLTFVNLRTRSLKSLQEQRIMLVLLFLFLGLASAFTVADNSTSANDNFSNGLFNDLAPLLALFGEQVTLQFLSHSTSWIENLIFALLPIGILTTVVSAIRVGGSRWLKAVIGRAREPEAVAELELMSSTSADICELWNGHGIVRVAGAPSMLELICRDADSTEKLDASSVEVYTLETAKQSGLYTLKSGGNDYESASGKNHSAGQGKLRRGSTSEPSSVRSRLPPNLFLNISGGAVSTRELVLVATVGTILQLGVLVYYGLITVPKKTRLLSSVVPYAMPFTVVGTLGILLGVYICAHVVEASTDEEIWESAGPENRPFRTVWLQRGQIVGDQVFRSFAIYDTLNQQVIRTSRKTPHLKRLEIWTFVGSALTVTSFIFQFIGLRAMHWSASVAQLLATIVMAILRLVIRRNLSMVPKTQELPTGYELDVMAKNINQCQDWKVFATPISGPGPGEKCNPEVSCCASRVLHTRIKLAELSGWPSEFPEIVDQLVQAIQASIDHIFTAKGDIIIKKDFQHREEFEWILPILVRTPLVEEEGKLRIILKRTNIDNKWSLWQVRREELEAVLSLWMSHFSQSLSSTSKQNLWILGPNSDFHRIIYDWWIYRGTQKVQIPKIDEFCLSYNLDEGRVFDLRGPLAVEKEAAAEVNGRLGVVTRVSLHKTCGQYLLASFLKSVINVIDKLEGKAHVAPGSGSNQFILVSDSIRGLAEAVQQSGLVSSEDSYRLLIPPLCDADMLQDPFEILEDVVIASKAQIDMESQLKQPLSDNTFWRLIYLCNRKAKLLSDEERWADAGRTFVQLIDVLSNALGSQDDSTIRAREAMEKFAAEFVYSPIGAEPEHPVRRNQLNEPFRLHAAAAKGYLDLVFEGIQDGIGVDTWDDEHETPISLAIKNNHLNIARLLIFYGAPVDHELLYSAVNESKSGLYPIGDEMVRILLLNLVDKTKLLFEASKKGYYGIMELLLSIGIDTTVKDSNGFMPLDIASKNGNAKMAKILIDHGADVMTRGPNGQSPLHFAVESMNLETINFLVEAGAYLSARDGSGQTPLHTAALIGSRDIVKYLVDKGVDLDGRQEDGQTALHLAAIKNHEEVVRWLINHGADQNAKDKDQLTALHLAARNSLEGVIEILSKDKTNLIARDKYGQDPLVISAREDGRESVARIFVERGADLELRDVSGRGALEYAAQSGHEAVMRLLIDRGAPLRNKDGFGRMALHYASLGGHVAIASLLIEKGVEVNAVDKDGWTALHYASRKGDSVLQRVLQEAGVDLLHKDRLGHTAEFYYKDGGEANFWTRALPPPYSA